MFKAIKSVDSILAAFHNTVKELEQVAEHHTTVAEKHDAEIQRLSAAKDDAVLEAEYAMTVAKNIKQLVNSTVEP